MPELAWAPTNHQLAFWLNAYKACMLQHVADHYPIERDVVGFSQRVRNMATSRPDNSVWWIRNVFDGEFCTVAGEERPPDEIEHEIIRPVFEEPRIHFAVNCAAYDCPQLREEACVGDRLEETLDDPVERLMAMSRHFRVEDGNPPTLRVNRVLDWFSEDFGGEEGIPEFFAPYLSGEAGPSVGPDLAGMGRSGAPRALSSGSLFHQDEEGRGAPEPFRIRDADRGSRERPVHPRSLQKRPVVTRDHSVAAIGSG